MLKAFFVGLFLLPFTGCVDDPTFETSEQYGTCDGELCLAEEPVDTVSECPAECTETTVCTPECQQAYEKSREGRNPQTGETIQIPAKTSLKFRQ
jgi:hypothetical protein